MLMSLCTLQAPKKPRAPKAEKPAAADGGGGDGEEAAADGAADGKKQRKPRKKKDPNAPKKALSAFMFFSNANREKVKTANPGVAFGQVCGLWEWEASRQACMEGGGLILWCVRCMSCVYVWGQLGIVWSQQPMCRLSCRIMCPF